MLENPLSVGVLKWCFWEGIMLLCTHLHVYEYGAYIALIWIMLIPRQMEIQVRVLTCSDMNSTISVVCFLSAEENLYIWKQKVKFCFLSSTFLCQQIPSMKALLNVSAYILSWTLSVLENTVYTFSGRMLLQHYPTCYVRIKQRKWLPFGFIECLVIVSVQ